MNPFDLDTVIVALITGIASFCGALLVNKAQQKTADTTADNTQVKTEGELREQLAQTDQRLNELSHLVSEEMKARRKAEAELYALDQRNNIMTAYVRAVGHWFGALCEVLDKEWADAHPKPRLPDEVRAEIEQTALKTGLQVDKQ